MDPVLLFEAELGCTAFPVSFLLYFILRIQEMQRNRCLLTLVVILAVLTRADTYSTDTPTWLTSSFMRAGYENVIKSLTGSSYDPIYTFTFSSALPGVPNLAYGIKQYRGNDYMGQEIFEVRRLSLTASTFTVQVDISGVTNIHIFGVPYIAVDPTFPHHLNGFDNVPINYGEALVNITSKSSSTTYYTNTVNYTQQASDRSYKTFPSPLSGNKILMYICSIEIWASFASGSTRYPIDLDIGYDILSSSTYRMTVSLSTQVNINKLHFSMIVFNSDDVESSLKYFIVFELWEVNVDGGFKSLPEEFVDNFIMGITDFETVDGKCGFEYQWEYSSSGGQFGVRILYSQQLSGACGFSKMKSTIFYMMTWQCQSPYLFFNLTTELCQTACGLYHFENYTVNECHSCEPGCSDCSNATACTLCTAGYNRELKNGNCECIERYFQNPSNPNDLLCQQCISNCLRCSNSTTCDECDTANWYVLIPNKTCQYCGYGCDTCNNNKECQSCRVNYYNATAFTCVAVCADGYFENDANNQCDPCAFACRTCSDATNCETCNATRDHRSLETISGVTYCTCDERYYQPVATTSTVCQPCISNCLRCSDSTTCDVCDAANWYVLIPNKTCQYCGYGCATCNNDKECQSCRVNYYNSTSKTCVTDCADGYYEDYATNECKVCAYNCKTCDDGVNCATCDADSHHRELAFEAGLQTCVCQERYYQAAHFEAVCSPCINECLTCSSSTTCDECNVEDYFLKIPNNTCHHCGSGCSSCDQHLRCQACKVGFHDPKTYSCGFDCPDGQFGDEASNQCLQCNSKCKTCTTATSCSSCDSTNRHRTLQAINGVSQCVCLPNYFEASPTSAACSPCISQCLQCSSGSTCEVCNEENGFLLIPNNTCQYCGYGCASCNNNLECTSCKTNFLNAQTHECSTNCPNYFFENAANNQCDSCPFGCHTCSSATTCESCDSTDNRELKTVSGVPTCVCKSGFYQASASSPVCSKCIEGCLECSSATTCDQCNADYSYLRIPNGTCQYCGDGCQTCNNDLECQSCSSGFLNPETLFCTKTCPPYQYGNSSSGQCVACSFGCLSCTNSTNCVTCNAVEDRRQLQSSSGVTTCECKPGFYQPSASTTVCEPCSANCRSCSSSTECVACDENNGYLLLPDKSCATCGSGCASCDNERQCLSCRSGFFWNPLSSECDISCPDYHFENSASNECEQCSFGCQECTSSTNCVSCRSATDKRELLTSGGVTSCECKEGFFQPNTSTTVCSACLPNCLSCSSPISCDLCDSNQGFLLLPDGTCQHCGDGCATCNDNKECQSCSVGALNTTTHECLRNCPDYFFENTNNQCEACTFACHTCTSATHCVSCSSGDHRELKSVSGVESCVCQEGYFQPSAGTICFACIRDCVTCSNETSCEVCDVANDYVLIPNGTCQHCGDDCATCTDSLTCTSCKSGFYNADTKTCDPSCPNYFFENNANNQCDPCPFACHTCTTATTCVSCSATDNRELKAVSGVDTCVCRPGFYQASPSSTVCSPCIANCLTCSSDSTCDVCDTENSYVLIPDGTCQNCSFGCTSCGNDLKCLACGSGFLDSANGVCLSSCGDYFFENSTNNQCEPCSFGCQTCSDSTTCAACDEQNDNRELQSVSGVATCICQPGFYSPSLSSTACSPCVSNCLTCSSNTECEVCDEAQGFLLLPDGTCKNCGSGCQECNNALECTKCKSGYLDTVTDRCVTSCPGYFYEDDSDDQCKACAFACKTCSSPTDCLSCDATSDHRELQTVSGVKECVCQERFYQRTVSTSVCFPCIANCLSCSTSTTCLTCDESAGYLLVPKKTCEFCGEGCKACNNEKQCLSCKAGFLDEATHTCVTECPQYFYGNSLTGKCETCPHGCVECSDSTSCFSCKPTDNRHMVKVDSINTCVCQEKFYEDTSTTVCQPCMTDCETCDDGISCKTCISGSGYLLLPNKTCHNCGNGCDQCNDDGFCESCVDSLTYNSTTGACECPVGQYTENSDMSCQPCSDRCATCQGPSQYECSSCKEDQHRILVRQRNGFVRCICNPESFVESTAGDPTCVKVSEDTCDRGYFYIKSKKECFEKCGDGLNYGAHECDDGNNESGDGCSSSCTIERGFECEFNSITSSSECKYTAKVDITSAEAFKDPLRNRIRIECVLSPIEDFFYRLNWRDGLVLIGPQMEVDDAWMEGGALKVDIDYFEDLTGKTLTIRYSSVLARSRATQRRLFSAGFDFDLTLRDYDLPIVPTNNLEPVYFSEGTYQMVEAVQSMTFLVALITLAVIALGLLLKAPFALLHLAFVLQLIFLSLGVVNSMNPMLSTVTEFSPIKGLRSTTVYFPGWTSPHTQLSFNIEILGYVTSFFGNMNVMMFLQLAMLSSSLALYLMAKKDLHFIEAFHFFKRQLMLVILFSTMNLFFSVGLFVDGYAFEILVAIAAVTTWGLQVFYLLDNLRNYHGMDQAFDLQGRRVRSKLFIGVLLGTRVVFALLISLLRESTLAACILILLIQIGCAAAFTKEEPYRGTFPNKILMIAEWIAVVFIFCNFLIKMKVFDPSEGEKYLSLFQVILTYGVSGLVVTLFGYSLKQDYLGQTVVAPSEFPLKECESDETLSHENRENPEKDAKPKNAFDESNLIAIHELDKHEIHDDPGINIEEKVVINLDRRKSPQKNKIKKLFG